ncbi:MAG: sigma-70 family RNA polymerase sigma factor [Pseudomonadota bacterium]
MASKRPFTEPQWAEFSARLRRYVSRRVSPSHVDDLTGDILVRLVANADKLSGSDKPLAWVHRVANNAIIDFHRRSVTEDRALEQAALLAEKPSEAANDAVASLSGCMIPFINRLAPHYAEALLLTEIGGLTQRAAAERLGLSVPGLKSRVQRGRLLLKQSVLRCCSVEASQSGRIVDYHRRSAAVRVSDLERTRSGSAGHDRETTETQKCAARCSPETSVG